MTDNPPQQGFGFEFRKIIPSLILTVLVAFGTSWWNSQVTQNELRYRLDRMEEKQRDASEATKQSAMATQQGAIRMAEISTTLTNMAEQLKEIKEKQR